MFNSVPASGHVKSCNIFFQARKVAERERKKEEVRKRLEEASRMKKAKKGFLTPERKKKLRVGIDFHIQTSCECSETAHDEGRRRSEAAADAQGTGTPTHPPGEDHPPARPRRLR